MTPLFFAIAAATGVTFAGTGAAPAGLGPLPDMRPAQQQPAQPAQAPAAIPTEILVLHGTNDNSGIDPKIGKLPELSKPPLSSYNSYKQLDRTSLTLAKGKSSAYKLPNGRELRVVYKDMNAPAKAGEPPRYVYTVSLHDAGGKQLSSTDYVAKSGEWFWLAGQEWKGGGLVLGFKINS